jgi:hypothetical protein
MRDAYSSTTASTAKKKLMQLASWLESNGEDSAAASLREGLDETLTVMRLDLPKAADAAAGTAVGRGRGAASGCSAFHHGPNHIDACVRGWASRKRGVRTAGR